MFKKYRWINKDGSWNTDLKIEESEESFELFKTHYHTNYGIIREEDNLISIHTGGWADNEGLINEFKETHWWRVNFVGSTVGGHYYFDLDRHQGDFEWRMVKTEVK